MHFQAKEDIIIIIFLIIIIIIIIVRRTEGKADVLIYDVECIYFVFEIRRAVWR